MLIHADAPEFTWWAGVPEHDFDGTTLSITAGRDSDWFIDPASGEQSQSSPLLVAPIDVGQVSFSATLSAVTSQRFDAAALYVVIEGTRWAKLALERNPLGELTLVSVVTVDHSDDCNHRVIAAATSVEATSVEVRVLALPGGAVAFHARGSSESWDLLRYFRLTPLGEQAPRFLGLSSQSPMGTGCRSTFSNITWNSEVPNDMRDGS